MVPLICLWKKTHTSPGCLKAPMFPKRRGERRFGGQLKLQTGAEPWIWSEPGERVVKWTSKSHGMPYEPCIYHIFTIYLPYINHIWTIYLPYIYHIWTIYLPCIYHIFTIYELYIYHIFTIYLPYDFPIWLSHIKPQHGKMNKHMVHIWLIYGKYMINISQMLHGAGIFANIYPKNGPVM